MPANLAILVGTHGRGSNMAAIAEACASGSLDARVAVVVAPTDDSQAVATAYGLGLEVAVLSPDSLDYASLLLGLLHEEAVDLVCLAGFMRLLPAPILEAFPGRVLNIHPALLPKFGGKGMYGMRVHAAVIAAEEKESGCTIHLVNERYDEGRILLQLRCPVLESDTPEALAARVLELEHRGYVGALARLIGHLGPSTPDSASQSEDLK